MAAERPASRSLRRTMKIEPATIQPRAIMLPVSRPATVRGSSDARARFSIAAWMARWSVQPTAAPTHPSSGRSAAMKIGRASRRTQRSRYRSTRSGMGISDAFKACVVKSSPGRARGGGRLCALYPGVEGYMFRGLCDYFVTLGSRDILSRAKARLDRLALYPEPVDLDGVRLVVAPWLFAVPRFPRFPGYAPPHL